MNELNVPVIGLSGHALNMRILTTLAPEERKKMMKLRGCPVNRRVKTTLTRDTFKRMCLAHQKKADVGGETKNHKCINTADGFKSNNWHVCSDCVTGEMIREGTKEFPPPENLTFIKGDGHQVKEKPPGEGIKKIKKVKRVKKVKKPNKRNQKLSDEMVKKIKQMFADGLSVNRIHFNIKEVVCKRTIYNIRKDKTLLDET